MGILSVCQMVFFELPWNNILRSRCMMYIYKIPLNLSSAGCLIVSWCFSGDGCGHTVLGVGSGSLASLGYPLSYPSHSVCEWEISVTAGLTVLVHIADLDIDTNNCQVSYLRLYNGIGPGRTEIGEKHLWMCICCCCFFLVLSLICTSNTNGERRLKSYFSFQNFCDSQACYTW